MTDSFSRYNTKKIAEGIRVKTNEEDVASDDDDDNDDGDDDVGDDDKVLVVNGQANEGLDIRFQLG